MKRLLHILGLIFLSALLTSACSSDTAECYNDTDCPGTQICMDGVCDYEIQDPCRDVDCPSGQICRDGDCLDMEQDADADGYPVVADCDDDNADINPGMPERCNEIDDDCDLQIDEDILCGQTCQQAQQNPAESPPATCNAETPCEQCYLYEAAAYYCLSLNGSTHAFMAHPQTTPCDENHHCETLRCDTQAWHCDGTLQVWIPGDVPTADQEQCNNIDDDCDGLVDGAAAAASCTAPSNGVARCDAGACAFDCVSGYHGCGARCLDNTSPESCGDRCDPCPAPEGATATCEAGVCGFVCQSGYRPEGGSCVACDDAAHCGAACEPCPGGLDCCDGRCVDLSSDPLFCGDCNSPCPSASDTCCPNTLCCDEDHPLCCGNYCCSTAAQCCPGDFCCGLDGNCCDEHCCNAPYSVCCGTGCCPDDHPVCWGQYCCNEGDTLCAGETGCCPPDYNVCCDDGSCCTTGTTCCQDGCCPAGYPVCCTGSTGPFCCPSGTSCCGDGCCAK